MLRAALLHEGQEHVDGDGFRLRGLGFSRLDGFSDVVFGFALTLLVVSLEVPKDYTELHHLLRGFVPFAISFLLLMLVWFGHYQFFRRFGTHDAGTMWLNGVLLFVVLFYVYPLKFLFLSALGEGASIASRGQMRELVLLYAGGFAMIYFLFAALYANGYRQREALALSPLERALTRTYIVEESGTGLVGVLVCLAAMVWQPGYACLLFLSIAGWKSYMGFCAGHISRTMRPAATVDGAHSEHAAG
jgi:uncharacterized membrane protein